MSGDILGTLRYMSPEQALGRRVAIDGRTDVYAFGVTCYELLTLQPAYAGKDRARSCARSRIRSPPPPRALNSAVPRDLETIVLKAMAKEPAERYLTARDLADDLSRFLKSRPIVARRPGLVDRTVKLARRNRQVVVASVAFLACALLALVAASSGRMAGCTAITTD